MAGAGCEGNSRRSLSPRRRVARMLSATGIVVLALGGAAAAAAEPSTLALIQATGILRVGTTGDYPPFSASDPATGAFVGSDVALAADLAAALQVSLELVPTQWKRLAADLEAGRFDVAMGGVSVTPERAALGHFTPSYLADGKTPITRCERGRDFQRVAQIDRPAVRVIVNPGGTNEAFARSHFPHASLALFADNRSIFDELLSGHADVMVTDAIEARLQQRLRPSLCAVHPLHPFDASRKAYLTAQDPALAAAVDAWLGEALRAGRPQALLERFLAYPWRPQSQAAAPEADVAQLALLIDARLALGLQVARYKWNHRLAIEDLPREQALLAQVRELASARGIDGERATAFFAAQIEASKTLQRALFGRWQAAGLESIGDAVDLATVIRPQLDALTPRLLDALARVPGPVPAAQLLLAGAGRTNPAAGRVAIAPLLSASAPAGAP